jgi:DNA polymerase III alpha subunit
MAEPREREWNEKGEYEELYPPEEVYAVIADMPNQVATTGDISNELGCTIDSGRNKLKELRFEHKIKKRDAGGRSDLWYIPIEDDEESAEADEAEDTDMALKRLSGELDEPITVGDTVYEDGDKHAAGEN